MSEKTVSWQLVAVVAVTAIVSGIVGWMVTKTTGRLDAGAEAEIRNAPAVVELRTEVSELGDQLTTLQQQQAAEAARASAERAALAQQSNQILDALLNN